MESARRRQDNTLVCIVDVKANEHQIKQAVKKLCDIDVAKVSTRTRPDGENKAYFWLASIIVFWMLPAKLRSFKLSPAD